jgi:hypothetical protein
MISFLNNTRTMTLSVPQTSVHTKFTPAFSLPMLLTVELNFTYWHATWVSFTHFVRLRGGSSHRLFSLLESVSSYTSPTTLSLLISSLSFTLLDNSSFENEWPKTYYTFSVASPRLLWKQPCFHRLSKGSLSHAYRSQFDLVFTVIKCTIFDDSSSL